MINKNFVEKNLPDSFAVSKVSDIKKLIDKGDSFTMLGMPGVGVSSFLRFVASTDIAYFAFVDIYQIVSLSKLEFLRQILKNLDVEELPGEEQQVMDAIIKRLQELSKAEKKIVIICNRFDQLSEKIDRNFLANLFQLTKVAPQKIVFIFTSNIPLYELCPDAISGYNLNFYSNFYYFGRYEESDIKDLLRLNFEISDFNSERVQKALKLSKGHLQLAQMMIKTESIENPILDRFVRLALSEICESLTHTRKNQIRKISQKKTVENLDSYLQNIGIVSLNPKQELFTPLLEMYFLNYVALKLPLKEKRLLKLLKKKQDEVVKKEELFDYIWQGESENASDWSLNALIYRLRKNPQFKSAGYEILSLKKQGYMLVKV